MCREIGFSKKGMTLLIRIYLVERKKKIVRGYTSNVPAFTGIEVFYHSLLPTIKLQFEDFPSIQIALFTIVASWFIMF